LQSFARCGFEIRQESDLTSISDPAGIDWWGMDDESTASETAPPAARQKLSFREQFPVRRLVAVRNVENRRFSNQCRGAGRCADLPETDYEQRCDQPQEFFSFRFPLGYTREGT